MPVFYQVSGINFGSIFCCEGNTNPSLETLSLSTMLCLLETLEL